MFDDSISRVLRFGYIFQPHNRFMRVANRVISCSIVVSPALCVRVYLEKLLELSVVRPVFTQISDILIPDLPGTHSDSAAGLS